MTETPCFYECSLIHIRHTEADNRFRYGMYLFYFDLDRLEELKRRMPLLGINRPSIVSFHERDYLREIDGPEPLAQRVLRYLNGKGQRYEPGAVLLLTQLRLFGYAFNPVSFYFCHDASGKLRNIIAEVNNTMGEQKLYLCETGKNRSRLSFEQGKDFYISPFIHPGAALGLDFRIPGELLRIRIATRMKREEGGFAPVLTALLRGNRRNADLRTLLYLMIRYPMITFRVTFLIHWQALKLLLKGVPYYTKQRADRILVDAPEGEAR